jgi:hypothetical protein
MKMRWAEHVARTENDKFVQNFITKLERDLGDLGINERIILK